MDEEIKLLFEEADALCWGKKPDESDDKWMQAASKILEEEAAASKPDVKWPPSKWRQKEPQSPPDESEVDEDEWQPAKRQKT
jgi:hypothetical protein